MPPTNSKPYCDGSLRFNPETYFDEWAQDNKVLRLSFADAIKKSFALGPDDYYVYRATANVTLVQVQDAINHGDINGLHAWYLDEEANQIPPPPQPDINAYSDIFSSTTSTTKALTAFEKNAKRGSIRERVALNLSSNRTFPTTTPVPKLKTHINPYLDFWAWSCRTLEWAGPDAATVNVTQSHHVLPVLYHHFGCVCPSFESLEVIRQVTKGRPVVDVGSGNGYWTYMLRRMGVTVVPVDNGDSIWRTLWVGDTVKEDGAKFLAKRHGALDDVLLLVYPQVTGSFTTSVLGSYKGSTICVAGTQNANGFTGFRDIAISEYIEKQVTGFKKVVQTPLPSFAGKDDALFVFERQ